MSQKLLHVTRRPKSPSIFEFVNTKMFFDMLRPLQEEYMIIAYFASEVSGSCMLPNTAYYQRVLFQLTARDFSCLEPNCFPFLRQVRPFNFYSQVHQPLLALQRISTVIWDEKETLLQLPCEKNKIHAFNFTDRYFKDHGE